MKNGIVLLIFICCIQLTMVAQNIGISATGAAPNASAMLDVSSTNKGLLMPRMTTLQRNAIATPAEGLKVYDTDTKTFWFYNGTGWIQSATGSAVNFWSLNGGNIFNNNTGNVGIGLNTPLVPLHIKNDFEALRLQGSSPFISFYDNAGIYQSFLQSLNNDLYLGTASTNTAGKMQFYLKNTPVMTLLPSGNVGIGNINPAAKLQIGSSVPSIPNGYDLIIGSDNFSGMGFVQSATISRFASTTDISIVPQFGSGNVGINVGTPVNRLQIGPATDFADYDFSIGRNNHVMAIYQGPNFTNLVSTANISLNPRNGAGYVGINAGNPLNKLQIGSVGNTGFAGNDLAIGNGTNAIAIYQTDASTLIGSTTDIILKPRNNGTGRVGINTNTPRAPLDVASAININSVNSNFGYGYLTFDNANNVTGFSRDDNPVQNVSIIASGRIYAREFDAFSDARIKNITGASNASQDLETINTLYITNYTMKDKVMYGSKHYKKVIAQEVEKVYPQVVSKHTDFIPNVYLLSSKITKNTNGYLLSFNAPHKISKAAKKLQVLMEGEGSMQQFDIISIPSVNEVIINATEIKGNKIFVYGEEVDDFRTVDYEGLTTLNISATQELSRLIKKQAAMIDRLEKRLSALEAKPLQRLVGIK